MAVAHDAVELHAVPCSVRSYFFYSVGSVVPFSPGGSAFLHVVPLIGHIVAVCLDRNSKLVAKENFLTLRLLYNDKLRLRLYDGDCCDFRSNCILVVIGNGAVELHAVPCCVGYNLFGCLVVILPDCPAVCALLLKEPLIGQIVAFGFNGNCKLAAEIDVLALRLSGDGKRCMRLSHGNCSDCGINYCAVRVGNCAVKLNAVP